MNLPSQPPELHTPLSVFFLNLTVHLLLSSRQQHSLATQVMHLVSHYPLQMFGGGRVKSLGRGRKWDSNGKLCSFKHIQKTSVNTDVHMHRFFCNNSWDNSESTKGI